MERANLVPPLTSPSPNRQLRLNFAGSLHMLIRRNYCIVAGPIPMTCTSPAAYACRWIVVAVGKACVVRPSGQASETVEASTSTI